jgi:hypothetical protein
MSLHAASEPAGRGVRPQPHTKLPHSYVKFDFDPHH